MTTKPRVKKFRVRRMTPEPRQDGWSTEDDRRGSVASAQADHDAAARGGSEPPGAETTDAHGGASLPARYEERPTEVDSPRQLAETSAVEEIRAEGLTGRQLRMARRVAQRYGISATSDIDAVRQLRDRGIDPFQKSNVLDLVAPTGSGGGGDGRDQLPATTSGPGGGRALKTLQTSRQLPSTEVAEAAERRESEISQIQRDMARRRRRRMLLLASRLAVFVGLPTALAAYYFFAMATPMYAADSQFVIQKAEAQGAAGLGGLFQGTSMATQQDSITVQSYLASRPAMERLDAEHGFKEHFSQERIDPIQRLPEGASDAAAYDVYKDHVKVSYDPTEGLVRMTVSAADPETSEEFSRALLGYAEEQVDQLTQRLREDQMAGARQSYEQAEGRRESALEDWLAIQQELEVVDPVGETSARTAQLSELESRRQNLMVTLQNRLNVASPNEAQVEALKSEIANIEAVIADLRSEMTQASGAGNSLASKNTELRLAEENYNFQTIMVQQALQQMEAARTEANRQVRYLSLGVPPVASDDPAYPRAFEDTVLAFLIFAGLYLMISITASVLREQVTN